MRKLLLFLALVAPLGICFPDLADFPFPAQSSYSDLAISHYPNAIYLLHSLTEWRQFPLWSNSILSGYPFASDPLSGLWYIPGWIATLFQLPLGFNLNVILHLVWGAVGVLIFLRKENKSDFAALCGAMIFELFSKNFAHYAAGHLTLMYAIGWTPWVFICEKYFHKGKRFLLAGVCLGMTALADVRWFAFLVVAWLFFALYERWIGRELRFWSFVRRIAINLGISLLIAAPLLLPLIEFTGLTTRSGMSEGDNLASSLPPAYLAGLAIPDLEGYAEWMVYPGGAALILALFSLSVPQLRRRNLFWIGTIVVSLIVALGSFTPVGNLLFRLPGFNLLRVPARVIFLVGWSFAVIAADCIPTLAFDGETVKGLTHKPVGNGLAIAALAGFLVLICVGLLVYTQTVPINIIWGTIAIVFSAAVVLARRSRRMPARFFIPIMIAFICLDLGGVDWLSLRFVPPSQVLENGKAEAAWIKAQNSGTIRVYSPSYSLPQQTAALYNLELADGVDPLQIQSYVSYMEKATGVPVSGYSVTLPPFASANPESDNRNRNPDAGLLGRLNVKYVVSAFDLSSANLILRTKVGASNIYENASFRSRAWVQPDLDPDNSTFRPVTDLVWKPNRISLKAAGEGWLILSEMYYPGWNASVDGKPVDIMPYNSIFRAIPLQAGEHAVSFIYNPPSVNIGIFLAGIGWLAVLFFFFFRRRKW